MPSKSAVNRQRAWGTRFDQLPTSPPSPDVQQLPVDPQDASLKKKSDDKAPHDASIFVGSLPSGFDQNELAHLLSQHLSPHAEIVSVKVVRDSRGGNCAFVQCTDADTAANLLDYLQSIEPIPFFSRILRFEPARAYRSLLVSYRTPFQYQPREDNGPGERVELTLPFAMRIWKPKPAKYMNLAYNEEAVNLQAQHGNKDWDHPSALHLEPVEFDLETIRAMASHFGPLEHCRPFGTGDNGNAIQPAPVVPFPHTAPRNVNMDAGCYEIKWIQRDDCVSALMTLRRVPHLTVTWAHQPPASGLDRPFQGQFSPQNTAPYPLYAQRPAFGEERMRDASFAHGGDSFGTSDSSTSAWTAAHPPPLDSACTSQNSELTLVDGTPVPVHHSHQRRSHEAFHLNSVSTAEWTETDFPPLGDLNKIERKLGFGGVWGERPGQDVDAVEDEAGNGTASKAVIDPSSLPQAIDDQVLHTGEALGIVTSMSGEFPESEVNSEDNGQDLAMPPTPGLATSPITPKTPPDQAFPPTPTDLEHVHVVAGRGLSQFDGGEKQFGHLDGEKVIDPTTLFVGGLEIHGPNAWDDEKVTAFFDRFGGLESVKLVRPSAGKAAFAFVKFNNTDSPARAVAEEHNRVYDGRAIRVQLRDCNPIRGNWKNNRGRGRYVSGHLHNQRSSSLSREPDISETPLVSEVQTLDLGQDPPCSTEYLVENVVVSSDEHTSGEAHTGAATYASHPEESVPRPESAPPSIALSRQVSPNAGTVEASLSEVGAPSTEHFREWYEIPHDTSSSPPTMTSHTSSSSLPQMHGMPPHPYHMPPGSYYGPPAWAPPYSHQVPYVLPFYGGYPPYGVSGPQSYPQAHRSESPGGPTNPPPGGVPQGIWHPGMGMYGAFIPYPGYNNRLPTEQSSQQPPVVPTGFIQNEQGTLIAVYQSGALDHYMSTSHSPGTTAPQPLNTAVNTPSGPQTLAHTPSTTPQPVPVWTVPPPPATGMPNQVGQRLPPASTQLAPPPMRANMGWIPSSQSHSGLTKSPSVIPQAVPSSVSMQHIPNMQYMPQQLDLGLGHSNYKRHSGRRDQPQQLHYNPNRNNSAQHNRGHGGRRGRGGGTAPGFLHTDVHHLPPTRIQLNTNPSGSPVEWNQWNGPR